MAAGGLIAREALQDSSSATSDQMESFDRINLLAKTKTWSIFREPMRTENALGDAGAKCWSFYNRA
jgi:hypothetical protein